jgi:hemoglobin
MTMAFGGPHNYTGKDMRDGHAHLVERGLNDDHFDAVKDNLGKALRELEVPEEKVAEVLTIVESTRDDVLGRAPVTT